MISRASLVKALGKNSVIIESLIVVLFCHCILQVIVVLMSDKCCHDLFWMVRNINKEATKIVVYLNHIKFQIF